jgi:hypothetical protein
MSDRDAWLNVAQAAQWLAEGRKVERRLRTIGGNGGQWWPVDPSWMLDARDEYRLKPEPPKKGSEKELAWLLDEARKQVARIQAIIDQRIPKTAEPPKPREWVLERIPDGGRTVTVWSGPWFEPGQVVRVREVLK